MSERPTILLCAPNGAVARYLLRTDIYRTLVQAAHVVVATPNADEQYLVAELGDDVVVEQLPEIAKETGSRFSFLLATLRRFGMANGHRSLALQYRFETTRARAREQSRWQARVLEVGVRMLWHVKLLRRAVLRLETRVDGRRPFASLFERHSPDLVVTGTPGVLPEDMQVLREARRRGVPSAVAVIAWDNPTSKGYRAADPDRYIVWSEAMAEQAQEFLDFKPHELRIGGVAHWDPYFREGELASREEVFGELGLDPARPLVFFATSSPGYYDRDAEVAEVIARAIDEGRLPSAAQLVIRPHPNFPGRGISMADFEALASRYEHVALDVPEIRSAVLRADMSPRSHLRLGALLKHSDCVVNVLSTTTIEAFAMDTPVVLIDSKGVVYHHLQELIRGEVAPVASSPEEIVSYVGRYLEDPSLDSEKRLRTAARELGPMDGRSGERIAGFLLEMVDAPTPAPALTAA